MDAPHDYVRNPAGAKWPEFAYFDDRWGEDARPRLLHAYPNSCSIGIELVAVREFTDLSACNAQAGEEYESLRELLTNLCGRYGIPRDRTHILGHEDVHPLARWGWDPGGGFDWRRVMEAIGGNAGG